MIRYIKNIIGRIFILMPILVMLFLVGLTFIIPLLWWIFSGESYPEWAIDSYDYIKMNLERKGWA